VKRAMFSLILLLSLIGSTPRANADCYTDRTSDLTAYAFETFTVSSTSLGFTSSVYNPIASTTRPRMAVVTLETNSIRIRLDGTDPTASVGHLVTAGQEIDVCGLNTMLTFRMIRVTSDAVVMITYFR